MDFKDPNVLYEFTLTVTPGQKGKLLFYIHVVKTNFCSLSRLKNSVRSSDLIATFLSVNNTYF